VERSYETLQSWDGHINGRSYPTRRRSAPFLGNPPPNVRLITVTEGQRDNTFNDCNTPPKTAHPKARRASLREDRQLKRRHGVFERNISTQSCPVSLVLSSVTIIPRNRMINTGSYSIESSFASLDDWLSSTLRH
jgi:hypothetical protein